MRRLILPSLAALVAAAVFTTTSTGTPPPAPKAEITVSRLSPVAGELFTGLIAFSRGERITQFKCDARIGGRILPGRIRRYDAHQGTLSPDVLSCSWLIPTNVAGKMLRTAEFYGAGGGYKYAWVNTRTSGAGVSASWRIQR
jgi:hypothetical protein